MSVLGVPKPTDELLYAELRALAEDLDAMSEDEFERLCQRLGVEDE